MAAPKTVLTYPLNGAQRDFPIPFEYLARKFVVVTLIGKTRQVLTLNSDYRFTARTTITTTKAWGPGDLFTSIELRRVTSATERLVDFADGSILRAYDLNTSQVQSLHIAEEARDLTADTIGVNNDGDLDARGRRIVNVGDGVLDGDAVSMGQTRRWAESALNQANRAETQANTAITQAAQATEQNRQSLTNNQQSYTNLQRTIENRQLAENAQKNSEGARDTSKQWADASAASAVKSETSNQQALVNNQQSYTNSVRAKTEADRAKTEADKLGNANEFMGTLINVTGGVPKFKDALQVGGSYGVTLRKEDLQDPATPYVVRMVHSADGAVRLIDDLRGRVRVTYSTEGHLITGNSVDAGADVLSRSGSFRSYAASENANAHLWFHGPASTRAVIYSDPLGQIMLAPAYAMPGSPGATIRITTGGTLAGVEGVVFATGNSLLGDGDIYSTAYKDRSLRSNLRAFDAPHRLQLVQLATGAVGNGTTITLTDDAWNYESFGGLYQGTAGVYTSVQGLRELANMPVNTQMYVTHSPNSYVLMAFRDTNTAQRRVLQFVSFGPNSGFANFYGFKRVPYTP
ncbi:phage tail fiber domain-containing protein [Pseudomonas fildesensis]|uniref:phage tail fiber domain-containing protein n=1 Tax=Pseudomonas fildesensis TaxID=1674920 RepID=UPI00069D862C|nr:phage tail fiber protein [Pseudomonas fildesensis]